MGFRKIRLTNWINADIEDLEKSVSHNSFFERVKVPFKNDGEK